MPNCSICGELIPEGSRTCSVCGSSADEFLPSATELNLGEPVVPLPTELPPGGSYCPACSKVYGAEYTDPFCECGTELLKELSINPGDEEIPMAPVLDELPPMAPVLEEATSIEPPLAEGPDVKVRAVKPPPGTPCLVLYGPDKQPLQYFTLNKDAMLIGRLDAVAGNFPDVDLDEWFDRTIIRRVSRQHALVLRTRASNTFFLRPLPGNTGTQLETQMLTSQQDYPLRPGHRIVLGGVIRLKFEIA
jgi:hypothetical protein